MNTFYCKNKKDNNKLLIIWFRGKIKKISLKGKLFKVDPI